jgi:hypothetical protein
MKKITAAAFLKMISENPSVFEHWNTPLTITDYVKCHDSPITLSKYLTFKRKGAFGDSASFHKCYNLQIATGTYEGGVVFTHSGIEKIENLTTGKDYAGNSASFEGCKSLKIATGTYPSLVTFSSSGIESIQNLVIELPKDNGFYADFCNCQNLQTLEGWDLSKPIFIESPKIKAEERRRATLKKFVEQTQTKELPFL